MAFLQMARSKWREKIQMFIQNWNKNETIFIYRSLLRVFVEFVDFYV